MDHFTLLKLLFTCDLFENFPEFYFRIKYNSERSTYDDDTAQKSNNSTKIDVYLKM